MEILFIIIFINLEFIEDVECKIRTKNIDIKTTFIVLILMFIAENCLIHIAFYFIMIILINIINDYLC